MSKEAGSSPSTLEALLAPRSLRLAGRPARGARPALDVSHHPPCRLARGRKRADVEVRLTATADQPAARAVLVAAGRTPRPAEDQLVLGRGCALWTPSLRVGIGVSWPADAAGDGSSRPCLIVTQGRAIAEHLVAMAIDAGLEVVGAIASGPDRPADWADLVTAARALNPAPVILVALHRRPPLERILHAGQQGPAGGTALLPLDEARWVEPPGDLPADGKLLPRISIGALADAAGWSVVGSPVELIRAGALLAHGLGPSAVAPLPLAATASAADEAALLASQLERAGLELAGARPRVKVTAAGTSRRRASPRLTVSGDGRGFTLEASGLPSLALPSAQLSATLAALAALRRTARPATETPRAARSSPSSSARERSHLGQADIAAVARHLDYRPAHLGEHDVRQILAAIGLPVETGLFVRSASAAATAARRIGHPVALRAEGKDLWGDPRAVIAQDLDSPAAVRGAFHRLLDRCRALDPAPVVDGMLVCPQLPAAAVVELSCGLMWLGERTLLLLDRPGSPAAHRQRPGLQRALPCPCNEAEAAEAARALLRRRADDSASARVSRFVERLAEAAALLGDRLRWLRIGRLLLTEAGELAVSGCYGVQRHHLLGLTL